MTSDKIDRVTLITPSRLHFGLIDLNGSLGRVDGGIGLAISEPNFRMTAEISDKLEVEASNHCAARARSVVSRLRRKFDFPGIRLKFFSELDAHQGFGSGTQLALGIGQAISLLYGFEWSVREIASFTGRGGTSGIGIAAFENGGIIVDGGHKMPLQKRSFLPSSATDGVLPPPIIFRRDFPNWNLLVVVPNLPPIHGKTEIDLFRKFTPQPIGTAERLSHLILMKLLPAIDENDIEAFGMAINKIQEFGWKAIEISARGKLLSSVLDFLLSNGAIGAGVSSWGAAIFALSESIDELCLRTEKFLKTLPESGYCYITKANNTGVTIVS